MTENMGFKASICAAYLLLVAVFLISATVSYGVSETNAEMMVCKMRCEASELDEKPQCLQQCEKYHTDESGKWEREDDQGSETSRGGGVSDRHNIIFAKKDPSPQQVQNIMLSKCRQTCQENPDCIKACMQDRFNGQGRNSRWPERTRRTEKQQSNNPYVFEDRHFTARLDTEHGSIRVLQKFTDKSELFNGIEKYRVAFLEAEPQTFVVPMYWDADAIIFVVNGKGTFTLIEEGSRQSLNIKRGDLFRVPAGISAYLINQDNNERLVLAKILHTVSVPGELQFFSVGGGNPDSSFYNAFSDEVIKAAFDVQQDDAHMISGDEPQKLEHGIFKKATEEQIKALAGKDDKKGKSIYNIFKKDPLVENENGILHEVDSKDFSELQKLNVAFSFFNITQGSMAGPFYNTKATLVLMVPNGVGRFEMACPHLSEQSTRGFRGQINPTYEKVSSELRQGTVVVIPAGHPVVIEAYGEENLEVIGFGLNSDENEWFPLAGQDNVISQWEDEAVELTFGLPASEVKKVIEKQSKKLFFKGPERSGRAVA